MIIFIGVFTLIIALLTGAIGMKAYLLFVDSRNKTLERRLKDKREKKYQNGNIKCLDYIFRSVNKGIHRIDIHQNWDFSYEDVSSELLKYNLKAEFSFYIPKNCYEEQFVRVLIEKL